MVGKAVHWQMAGWPREDVRELMPLRCYCWAGASVVRRRIAIERSRVR